MNDVVIDQYKALVMEPSWPRMRPGATLVTISERQDDGSWLSWIEGRETQCGGGSDVFESIDDMRDFVEGGIAIYVDEPDENLTQGAIEHREWLLQTFKTR